MILEFVTNFVLYLKIVKASRAMHLVSLGIGGAYPSFYSNTTCLHHDGALVEVGVEGSRALVPQVVGQMGIVVDEPGAQDHCVHLD